MIEIDGFWWFIAALVICGAHVLYLRDWRHERHEYMQWREAYNAVEQKRHDEFMRALNVDHGVDAGWNLYRSERGQA